MIAKTFKEKNFIFGLNQPEYVPLPAFLSEVGDATLCFELSEKEKQIVLKDKQIWIQRLTFGARMQPIVKTVLKPQFSKTKMCDYRTNETVTSLPVKSKGLCIVCLNLGEKELKQIEETSLIWITIFTFSTKFQPILLTVKNPYK